MKKYKHMSDDTSLFDEQVAIFAKALRLLIEEEMEKKEVFDKPTSPEFDAMTEAYNDFMLETDNFLSKIKLV